MASITTLTVLFAVIATIYCGAIDTSNGKKMFVSSSRNIKTKNFTVEILT